MTANNRLSGSAFHHPNQYEKQVEFWKYFSGLTRGFHRVVLISDPCGLGVMSNQLSRGIFLFIIAFLLLPSCSDSKRAAPANEVIATPATEEIREKNKLTIIFPQTATEVVGGQSFRVTLLLEDFADQPVAGAMVTAEIWTPGGELFATLPFVYRGGGGFLADSIALPLRESQGVWRVVAEAEWGNGMTAQRGGQFSSLPSYSERLQQLFGFWIDLTDLFGYNVPNAENPRLKTYPYKNGGYVILANNLTVGQIDNSFVILDVHWRQMDLPQDQAAAVDYALNLAGPHGITLDIPTSAVMAERTHFQGWPGWHVTSRWERENAFGNPARSASLDWMIFRCPGSDWLWTILITTNTEEHLDDLRSIRESFACFPN